MDSNTGGVPALILAHDGTETEVHISRDVRVTLRRVDGMLVVGVFTDPMPSPEYPDYFATYHNIPVHLSTASLKRTLTPRVERTRVRNKVMYWRRVHGASIEDLMQEFGLARGTVLQAIQQGRVWIEKEERDAGGA
jgi:uncharacterized protein (DUF433 family)